VSAVGRNIWICPSDSVVNTSGGVEVYIQLRVVWVGQVRSMEVRLDMTILVGGAMEVIRESTGG